MRRAVTLGGLLLSLAACRFPLPGLPKATAPVVPPSAPVEVSSDAASSEAALEFGDAVVAASSAGHASASSKAALPERVLENGVLEVGAASAPAQLLIFTHQSCRYCREFWLSQFPRLRADFVDTGKLRVKIALVPLRKYPESELQEYSLLCAALQGKGLAMHDFLFRQATTDEAALLLHARELQLREDEFRSCLHGPASQAVIGQHDLAEAHHVTLVPTMVLWSGEKYIGAHTGLSTYPDLRGRIEKALRE